MLLASYVARRRYPEAAIDNSDEHDIYNVDEGNEVDEADEVEEGEEEVEEEEDDAFAMVSTQLIARVAISDDARMHDACMMSALHVTWLLPVCRVLVLLVLLASLGPPSALIPTSSSW